MHNGFPGVLTAGDKPGRLQNRSTSDFVVQVQCGSRLGLPFAFDRHLEPGLVSDEILRLWTIGVVEGRSGRRIPRTKPVRLHGRSGSGILSIVTTFVTIPRKTRVISRSRFFLGRFVDKRTRTTAIGRGRGWIERPVPGAIVRNSRTVTGNATVARIAISAAASARAVSRGTIAVSTITTRRYATTRHATITRATPTTRVASRWH